MVANVALDLNAVIVALAREDSQDDIRALIADAPEPHLPAAPFDPRLGRTMELALRRSVRGQTDLSLGYVEQLYTFGDRDRSSDSGPSVSVGHLALARIDKAHPRTPWRWRSWYDFLPWEDSRDGAPRIIAEHFLPALSAWAARPPQDATDRARGLRHERVQSCFLDWDATRALERYELLYEAGLVAEAARDGAAERTATNPGATMRDDGRRILATALSRLRAKIAWRPIVFELLPEAFTLRDLQHAVEAIAGARRHTQNFRRQAQNQGLLEPTGQRVRDTGRPAELFRFRPRVRLERPQPLSPEDGED